MKLYEIADAIEQILAAGVDTETGEITEEAIEALEGLELALEEKVLNTARYAKGEIAEAEGIESEADKLIARAKIHRNRAARLERYITLHMPEGEKYGTSNTVVESKLSPGSVEIVDEKQVPADFVEEKVVTRIDKRSALPRLKAGEEIPGLRLYREYRVKIK